MLIFWFRASNHSGNKQKLACQVVGSLERFFLNPLLLASAISVPLQMLCHGHSLYHYNGR